MTWRGLPKLIDDLAAFVARDRDHPQSATMRIIRVLVRALVRDHRALLVEVEGLREVRAAYQDRDRILAEAARGRGLGSLQAAELQRARDTLKRYGEPCPGTTPPDALGEVLP
jgi:hypothetical protein